MTDTHRPSEASKSIGASGLDGTDGADGTRTIKASEFKARCLKLMDEVAETGREIVITKNGRPVSRLVPHRQRPASLFGRDKDKIKILGDIMSPIDVDWNAVTGENWDGLL